MTSEPSQKPGASAPGVADRCYRSPAALAAGVLLLILALWIGGDALIGGGSSGGFGDRTSLTAAAALVLLVPSVVAFTLRPAVFAGQERLRIRNPFRTITIPWGALESLRAGYSTEAVAGGRTYQLWAIPVSLRARKRAARRTDRAARRTPGRRPSLERPGFLGIGASATLDEAALPGDHHAPSDQALREMQTLADDYAARPAALRTEGAVTIRWAYEILAPAALGALALIALYATR